jgi:hypothetical protein
MAFSFSNLLKDIEAGLTAVANIGTAVQAIKATGASKESTLQKVVTIVEAASQAGEAVPIPQVSAASTLVNNIVEEVFGAPAAPATAAVPLVPAPAA